MEPIAIVKRRSRVWPLLITLIVLALIVAAVLFLMNGGRVDDLASVQPPDVLASWRQVCFSFAT
jgi:hypothetical protein